jgi:ribonuclease BN (tRNA processing enzyme)
MWLTVLGGCGAFPAARQACSGYLLESDAFRLLIDPGYAVATRLLERMDASELDAVLVTHGHPDHCADLNPLLRARAFRDIPAVPLPVYALPGALDAVLALDRPGVLDDAIDLSAFEAGDSFAIGPFKARTALLPHSRPNAGVRLEADGASMTYTGDAGPSPALVALARGSDLLLAEASYAEAVPASSLGALCSAADAGRQAAEAAVARVVLTHLIPPCNPDAARRAAERSFEGPIDVAAPGLALAVGGGEYVPQP